MKKIAQLILISSILCTFYACEVVKEEAPETPIGSVISGKTTDTDAYIKRVSERNRSLDKDTWRPQNNEQRF